MMKAPRLRPGQPEEVLAVAAALIQLVFVRPAILRQIVPHRLLFFYLFFVSFIFSFSHNQHYYYYYYYLLLLLYNCYHRYYYFSLYILLYTYMKYTFCPQKTYLLAPPPLPRPVRDVSAPLEYKKGGVHPAEEKHNRPENR